MLTDPQKDRIRELLTNISNSLPSYRSRYSQRRMIAEVANALARAQPRPESSDDPAAPNEGESILAVQGPTGTGKSLAYLIAAAYMARETGRKLVISSATVSLQEQLINKDLPFFTRHSGFQSSYVLAKGRSRYVCELRLRRAVGDTGNDAQEELFESATWDRKPEENEIERLRQILKEYKAGKWSGDRDELTAPISVDLWGRITTDRHGCLNKRCEHYNNCAQMRARAAIRQADIVVANHDLLLADLALGGGVILPEPEQSFYVLDEAHHLTAKALDAFAAEHAVGRSIRLLERTDKLFDEVPEILDDAQTRSQIDQIIEYADVIIQALTEIEKLLKELPELLVTHTVRQPSLRIERGTQLGESLCGIGENIGKVARQMEASIERITENLDKARETVSGKEEHINALLTEIGAFMGRFSPISRTWALVLQEDDEDKPPVARWIMAELDRNGSDREFHVCASPVSAASDLSTLLWKRAGGAILTSATLCSMGSFDKLLYDTGLSWFPKTTTVALNSPFNFERQGELVVPKMRSNPKDAAAHTAEIIDLLPGMIDLSKPVGTLVLFSSRRQMQDVAEGLPPELRAATQLQGERANRTETIDAHVARIKSGKAAVLFGLDSFAEGLDLAGDACNHVIIAKLPFSVPDHPVAVTLSKWIESRGGNPFMQITVPAACLKLIQAVGRLIRTEDDYGRVTILDTRIVSTRYGRMMMDSLPPFRRIIYGKEQQPARDDAMAD